MSNKNRCPSRKPDRLYGISGAERFYFDPMEVYESEIDGQCKVGDTFSIEEWTIAPPLDAVPPAVNIVENIVETMWDDGFPWSDDPWSPGFEPFTHPKVLEAAERLREAIAATVSYHAADKQLACHILLIPEDMEDTCNPIYDGERLYRQADEGNP